VIVVTVSLDTEVNGSCGESFLILLEGLPHLCFQLV
jgi:hypothetical protein